MCASRVLAPLVLLAVIVVGVVLFPPFADLGGSAPPDVADAPDDGDHHARQPLLHEPTRDV